MRTNSIISDPEPLQPVVPALSGQKKPKPNDFEKIANSEDFPQFAHYVNSRIEYYQRFTPGGVEIEKLTKEQRIEAWDSAVVIIKEFEGLMNSLDAFKRKPDEAQTT
jgi:hypothetical protein